MRDKNRSRDGHSSVGPDLGPVKASKRNPLLTYSQKTPVSPLRLVQDPGWGFILEIRMVSHHHRLSLWYLVAWEGRLVVLGRHIVCPRSRIVALLHHVHILLLLLLMLMLLLLGVMRRRMLWGMWHRHGGGNGHVLRDNRRRAFVHGDRVHLDTWRGVKLVVGRCGM
jgi:hypothetical protein